MKKQDGGAISFQNTDAAIANGIFAGNTAQKGGAIAVIGGTTLSLLSDTAFFNNAAILNGDDIFIDNTTLLNGIWSLTEILSKAGETL